MKQEADFERLIGRTAITASHHVRPAVRGRYFVPALLALNTPGVAGLNLNIHISIEHISTTHFATQLDGCGADGSQDRWYQ
jgi:hypothetical protein